MEILAVSLLVLSLLVADPAFADVVRLTLNISQKVFSGDDRIRNDLVANVLLNIKCSGQNGDGTLTVSVDVYGPDGQLIATDSQILSGAEYTCGQNFVRFVFLNVITQSGFHTIRATASIDGFSVTDSHSFDPRSEGTQGALG